MDVVLVAILILVLSGITALALARWPRTATALGAGGAVLGCAVGVIPTPRVLLGASPESLRANWDAAHGAFWVEVDALSSFFLLPVFGLSALAAVYGGNYLLAYRRQKSLGAPWFFFNLFVAGMATVVIARTALLFLVAWEVMSIAAYCLLIFEHERADVRKAGWVYLVATHLGVAFLFLAFVLLGRNAGSLDFEAFRTMPPLTAGWAGLIFLLAVIGFGTKAGFVPFHVWLPEAHPAAPSHVSALMSGVMIKLGFYGILRVLTFLGPPAVWWGPTLAGLGLLTGLVGIALALQPRDVKRVLAYSSIENIGLVAVGVGVGLWASARQLPLVAALGFAAGLLHLWNHALMKGLMFFAAGSILHATHSKDLEQLGGLMKRMPWTGGGMLVGAVAIAALPPLNGFVSEWLMYLSLLKCGLAANGGSSLPAFFGVGLLALIGTLAVVAFVRLTGIALLGSPRSEAAQNARESSPWMLGPMVLLVLLCLAAAVFPQTMIGWMSGALEQVLGREAWRTFAEQEQSEAPLSFVGQLNAVVLVAIASGVLGLLVWSRRGVVSRAATWGCGYIMPTVRMQYTGGSFAEMIAEQLLPQFLRPRTARRAPRGLFPAPGDFRSDTPDPVSERVYEPFFRRTAERFSRLRILQQGKLHVYLVYILLVVVVGLAWASVRPWWTMF